MGNSRGWISGFISAPRIIQRDLDYVLNEQEFLLGSVFTLLFWGQTSGTADSRQLETFVIQPVVEKPPPLISSCSTLQFHFYWRPFYLWEVFKRWIGALDKNCWPFTVLHLPPLPQYPLTLSITTVLVSLISLPYVIWDAPKKLTQATMKTILMSVCVYVCLNNSAKQFKTEPWRQNSTFYIVTLL